MTTPFFGLRRVTNSNMDFDYDAIQAARRTAALIRDPKGNLMNISLSTLVVRAQFANSFRAQEILGAIRSGGKGSMPASADNDAAGVPAFDVIELPWVETNTAYWWAFDSSMVGPKFGLQYKESQPISLEGPNVVFKTSEIQYKTTMIKKIVIDKPSLINGESPVVGNPQQASESCAAATTEREGILGRVSDSLVSAYNKMKAERETRRGFSATMMFDSTPFLCYA